MEVEEQEALGVGEIPFIDQVGHRASEVLVQWKINQRAHNVCEC